MSFKFKLKKLRNNKFILLIILLFIKKEQWLKFIEYRTFT